MAIGGRGRPKRSLRGRATRGDPDAPDEPMPQIILLACGSALYPILLGAVIVMLAGPRPVPLLGA